MFVAGYDENSLGRDGAFQDGVVRRVLRNGVDFAGGFDEYGHGFEFFGQSGGVGDEGFEFFVGKHADEFGKEVGRAVEDGFAVQDGGEESVFVAAPEEAGNQRIGVADNLGRQRNHRWRVFWTASFTSWRTSSSVANPAA